MIKRIGFILLLMMAVMPAAEPAKAKLLPLSGPYLGQTPPGAEPRLFASGIVNTGLFTRDVAMTPDGKEIYFCSTIDYVYSTILVTRQVDGFWTEPEVMEHMENPDILNFEPCISPDGQKFFFLSTRPDNARGETKAGDQDIWVMERQGAGWGEPYNLGEPVNTAAGEFYPSLTRDHTLYFTRSQDDRNEIFRSRLVDGRYQSVEKLPVQVNSGQAQYNAFITPDESFLIVPTFGRKDSLGGTDYYIIFHNADDTWDEPVNLGPTINTPGNQEYSASLSADGRYLFFMSARRPQGEQAPKNLTREWLLRLHNQAPNGRPAIWWVESSFLNDLKKKTTAP